MGKLRHITEKGQGWTQGSIMKALSDGYIVLAGESEASLIPRPKWIPFAPVMEVAASLIQEMIDSHLLGEINEEGYPPVAERPKNGSYGWKAGWREMGLEAPPEEQAYYLLIQ